MRYLIVAMPGCGNLGDDLISSILQKKIISQDSNAEIGVLCGESSDFECVENVIKFPFPRNLPSKYGHRKRAIINYIRKCDRIFIGGGGLFQDSHNFFTIHKYLHWLFYAKCQIDCVGVGVGPINHSFNVKYLTHILNRPGITVQVRDLESYNYLKKLKLNNIVLGCDIVEGSDIGIVKTSHNGSVLGCSIRKWMDMNMTKVVQLINNQVQQMKISKVYLFVFEHSFSSSEEFDFLTELSRSICCHTDIWTYGKDDCFFEKIAEVDFAIASRFHANILWQKIGVPVIPIPYAPKVYSLYSREGHCLFSFDSDKFSDEYLRIKMFDVFEIQNPYSKSEIKFSFIEKIGNKICEIWCFVQSVLNSLYCRL